MLNKLKMNAIFVFIAVLSLIFIPTLYAGGITLFTQEEAEKLNISMDEWFAIPKEKDPFSSGPDIIFNHPKVLIEKSQPVLEAFSPTDLSISFIEKNAPVKMDSLEVKVCKSVFCKSLDKLLKGYISGTDILAKDIKVPKGKYHVKIKIADQGGNITSGDYLLRIASK